LPDGIGEHSLGQRGQSRIVDSLSGMRD
jgi:hypothetical protein